MKYLWLSLIWCYQRMISPFKGFHCAHNRLHRSGSCSAAVEEIILDDGLYKGWPRIRQRFNDCRQAHQTYQTLLPESQRLPSADIGCDIPCGGDFFSCDGVGGKGGGSACSDGAAGACSLFFDLPKKLRRILAVIFLIMLLVLTYIFYGREVNRVYLTDLGGEKKASLVSRIMKRDHPEVRILLISDGAKYYSDIIYLEEINIEYTFYFEEGPTGTIDALKVVDALINVGDALHYNQVLEQFDTPEHKATGTRFSYQIERRWHLF